MRICYRPDLLTVGNKVRLHSDGGWPGTRHVIPDHCKNCCGCSLAHGAKNTAYPALKNWQILKMAFAATCGVTLLASEPK